ncbi:WD40-repeat-containing domain protein [Chytridium lagenaria]|nr:WD40-repeat-containing domain protein [Chytridium lagenaria]
MRDSCLRGLRIRLLEYLTLHLQIEASGFSKPLSNLWLPFREAHKFSVTSVAWYPVDPGIFVSGSMDSTVRVWDTDRLETVCTFALGDKVNSLAFSPPSAAIAGNGHTLLAAATQGSHVRLCDLRSGTMSVSMMGHGASVMDVAWSGVDANMLVSGSMDSTINVWDVRNHKRPLKTLDPRNAPQAILSNATASFSSASSTKRTRQGTPKLTGAAGTVKGTPSVRLAPVNGLAFVPGKNILVSAGHDCQLRLWDLAKGEHINTQVPMIIENKCNSRIRFNVSEFPALSSPGIAEPPSLFAAVPCDDEKIILFDLSTGAVIKDLVCHWGRISCVAARVSVQELYSGGWDDEILCWTPEYISEPIGSDRVKVFSDEPLPRKLPNDKIPKASVQLTLHDADLATVKALPSSTTSTQRPTPVDPFFYRLPVEDDDNPEFGWEDVSLWRW